MTDRERAERVAIEALKVGGANPNEFFATVSVEVIEQALTEVRLEERERCAELVRRIERGARKEERVFLAFAAREIAKAIRGEES